MTSYQWTFCGTLVEALPEGALLLPDASVLVVSDLHLGKAERIARREGRLTPPYEARETLARLDELVARRKPRTVICLGDSFDDDWAAQNLGAAEQRMLSVMLAGRRWVWITGNHDPGPIGSGGESLGQITVEGIDFRHEAIPGRVGEVSGHYHPKARLRGRGRASFLIDDHKIIMPAFGTYTGGLDVCDGAFDALFAPGAIVLMTGRQIVAAPREAMGKARRLTG